MHCNNHLMNEENQELVTDELVEVKTSEKLLIISVEFREYTSQMKEGRKTEGCQHVTA